jgi:hypothetical protein
MSSLSLQINDPFITPEGLGIAFGHLYASYSMTILKQSQQALQRASLLKSVLSSAMLLRLNDLAHLTIQLIKTDISVHSVILYTHFVANSDQAQYQEIRDTIFDFLCNGITNTMSKPWEKESDDYLLLVSVFSKLPFDWLKKVIESKTFQVPSDMERYVFY